SGCQAPVDVSAWMMPTSLGRRQFLSAVSTCSARITAPHGASTRTTVAPARAATSAIRPPKTPFTHTTISSPGSTRLTTHPSMPALPVPEIGMVRSLVVPKTTRSRAFTSSIMVTNAGSRWPSRGRAIAASTRGCTCEGPGPSSRRRGGRNSPGSVTAAHCTRARFGPARESPCASAVQNATPGARTRAMRAAGLASTLRALVGRTAVLDSPAELRVYDCDGYTLERAAPELVVLPRTPEEVAAVVRCLAATGVAFVPRGAGTGLSGGTLPVGAPVMICTSRLQQIERVDLRNRRAVVQAGVVNQWVTNAVRADGLLYAPDPSSQPACTIGGNIAENSGGPHTLKYGVTVNHVLGLEIVLASGEVVQIGGAVEDRPGYDLVGLVVGSEGTFGIVTRATLRLLRAPEAVRTLLAVFDTVEAASEAVSGVSAAGIAPAALEMMDRLIVGAVGAAFGVGLPTDAGAVLLLELDGAAPAVAFEAARARDVCMRYGASEVRVARDEAERAALWKCRKRAFGAVGRLAPNYCTQDGVVPRTRVPEVLRAIGAAAAR